MNHSASHTTIALWLSFGCAALEAIKVPVKPLNLMAAALAFYILSLLV